MGKTLISRRGGVRGVSVGACAAALAVSLTFASTALAETAPDAPFGEPVAADAGFAQGASAGAYAADAGEDSDSGATASTPAADGAASTSAPAASAGLDVSTELIAASDQLAAADAAGPAADPALAATDGWATGADGARHWYEGGAMAADKAFYDPAADAWYWADADGTVARDKDVFIPVSNDDRSEGKWVRFDAEGCMVKGEDYRYGGWYLFDETTGEMAKGFRHIDSEGGKWVFYDQVTGKMCHGQENVSGRWYLFDENTGATCYGFQYIAEDDKWVFYDRTMGWMLYGEQNIDGNWYYLGPTTGEVDRGWSWLPDSNKWVYYDQVTGIMQYGWQDIDGEWYWLDACTGESDYAQVLRWRMRTASGEDGINFFNDGACSPEAFDALVSASNEFWDDGYALGYVMMDLSSGKGVCSNIDYTFYGASTVKAPYCMSVMDGVFGFDGSAADGCYGTMHDAITWSSNSDYLALRSQFGSDVFCDWLSGAGVDGSIGSDSWESFTPRELGKIWLQMYSDMGKGTGGPTIYDLTSNTIHSAIREAVGDRCTVCSKPGWVPAGYETPVTNDAGIVYSPDGDYLVVVLSTKGDQVGDLSDVVAALDAIHSEMVR